MAGFNFTALLSTVVVGGAAIYGAFFNMENNRRANYQILNQKLVTLDEQTAGTTPQLNSLELVHSLVAFNEALRNAEGCSFNCPISADQHKLLGAHFSILRCVRLPSLRDNTEGTTDDITISWRVDEELRLTEKLANEAVYSCNTNKTEADEPETDVTLPDTNNVDTSTSSEAARFAEAAPLPKELRLFVQFSSREADRSTIDTAIRAMKSKEINALGPEYIDTNIGTFQLRYLKSSDRENADLVRRQIVQLFPACGWPDLEDLSARYEYDDRVRPGTLELWFPSDLSAECRATIETYGN